MIMKNPLYAVKAASNAQMLTSVKYVHRKMIWLMDYASANKVSTMMSKSKIVSHAMKIANNAQNKALV